MGYNFDQKIAGQLRRAGLVEVTLDDKETGRYSFTKADEDGIEYSYLVWA